MKINGADEQALGAHNTVLLLLNEQTSCVLASVRQVFLKAFMQTLISQVAITTRGRGIYYIAHRYIAKVPIPYSVPRRRNTVHSIDSQIGSNIQKRMKPLKRDMDLRGPKPKYIYHEAKSQPRRHRKQKRLVRRGHRA